MKEIRTGQKFNVKYNRVPKAKLHLTHDACSETAKVSSCECTRHCYNLFSNPADVRRIRAPVFTTCDDETAVNAYITSKLQATGAKYIIHGGKEANSHSVCRLYYATIHGVSVHAVKKARQLAQEGRMPQKKRSPATKLSEKKKYNIAWSFWDIFFKEHCQKPNDLLRLFPVDKPFRDIYNEYFTPWFDRLVGKGTYSAADKPMEGTWKKARYAKEFNDVKHRRSDTHARCGESARLKALNMKSFKNGASERKYKQERRLHDEEITQWRKLEEVIKAQAVSSPSEHLVIMHDGTSALGLPCLSRRSVKNLDPFRFEVTPWLAMDYSGDLKDYIYSTSCNTPKDANTLISQVHLVIRRAKSDYTHPRHRARTLTIVAASASENKNNTLFMYCTDLVNNGWFDEVILLFGPVGHTHNGVDASHKVHNQNVANHVAGDLGHFVQNYVKGYKGTRSEGDMMPNASILSKTLNWNKYYTPCMRRVGGFTKTSKDPVAVRGFKISKHADGTTSVQWKVDPALEKEWRGAAGVPNTNGFYVMASNPRGLPEFVMPVELPDSYEQKARKLKSHNMWMACAPEGLSPCVPWLYKAASRGIIPINQYMEDTIPAGKWGRLAEVGAVPGSMGYLRVIDSYWDTSLKDERATLWALPVCPNGSHLEATSNKYHFMGDAAMLQNRRLPRFGYADEKAADREVAHHPQGNRDNQGWTYDDDAGPGAPLDERAEHKEPSDNHKEKRHEEKERKEPDKTPPPDPEPRLMRFEEDFKMCKPGSYCVGLAEAASGPSPYIFVGLIISVEKAKDKKSFHQITMHDLRCTSDPWTKGCLDKPWHRSKTHATAIQVRPHYSVMSYSTKLNNNGRLPKAMRDAVGKREGSIVWHT
jgi:hypothetical protein